MSILKQPSASQARKELQSLLTSVLLSCVLKNIMHKTVFKLQFFERKLNSERIGENSNTSFQFRMRLSSIIQVGNMSQDFQLTLMVDPEIPFEIRFEGLPDYPASTHIKTFSKDLTEMRTDTWLLLLAEFYLHEALEFLHDRTKMMCSEDTFNYRQELCKIMALDDTNLKIFPKLDSLIYAKTQLVSSLDNLTGRNPTKERVVSQNTQESTVQVGGGAVQTGSKATQQQQINHQKNGGYISQQKQQIYSQQQQQQHFKTQNQLMQSSPATTLPHLSQLKSTPSQQTQPFHLLPLPPLGDVLPQQYMPMQKQQSQYFDQINNATTVNTTGGIPPPHTSIHQQYSYNSYYIDGVQPPPPPPLLPRQQSIQQQQHQQIPQTISEFPQIPELRQKQNSQVPSYLMQRMNSSQMQQQQQHHQYLPQNQMMLQQQQQQQYIQPPLGQQQYVAVNQQQPLSHPHQFAPLPNTNNMVSSQLINMDGGGVIPTSNTRQLSQQQIIANNF